MAMNRNAMASKLNVLNLDQLILGRVSGFLFSVGVQPSTDNLVRYNAIQSPSQ